MNVVLETDDRTGESERPGRPEWEPVTDDSEEVLEVLGDEYTIAVLTEVLDEPLPVSTVAEQTSMSRTTAFRRLDRLEDLGLVEVTQCLDDSPGLHRYKAYRTTVDGIAVEFTEDEFRIEITRETSRDCTTTSSRSSAADRSPSSFWAATR